MSPFQIALLIFAAYAAALIAVILAVVVRWNARLWLPAYIRSARKRRQLSRPSSLTHVLFAVVDHFEPVPQPGHGLDKIGGAMADWVTRYPGLAARHRDSDGRPPRHTWAFPVETYKPECLEQLAELCRQGLGEVEVQIHHDGDTATTFRARMTEGLNRLASHGIGTIRGVKAHHFGFVHGNWALANSRPDRRWCGVNNEITVLRELGCFADATLPSAPSPTQTSKINSIYYATDDPDRPKSHDTGIDVEVGRPPSGDLMIVQGPLLLDWSKRKLGFIPGLENGEITGTHHATPQRVDAWVRARIGVIGRPEWVFVKVHCHGAVIRDRDALLGAPADDMLNHLENEYGSGALRLHYVTLREMYNIIKAAEAGKSGNPNDYRDFVLPAYDCVRTGSKPPDVSK